MEKEQKIKFEKTLNENMKVIKKNIASYKQLTRPIPPDNAIGRITRMEAINSKSINEAALERAKHTLSKLEKALLKIHNPDFGLCRDCEEPIPFARLMIMPETDICVQCAGNIDSSNARQGIFQGR
ncbi:MAG: TraR/DksA C4-type zinc finger protein [Desulfamplus sp.]|nr:TraR/DksA C4-type zinc finger protein [Desulfamplus sp.]